MGAPKVTGGLKSRGIDVSVATVGRLMAELGIQGASGRAKTIGDEARSSCQEE